MKLLSILYRLFTTIYGKISAAVGRFDMTMRKRYRPARLAALATAAVAALMIFMLFVPPYLGLSNDGSYDKVLLDTGLQRLNPDDATPYFTYYEREYRYTKVDPTERTTPFLLEVFVRLAKGIDLLVTQDDIFDVRFLAGLYFPLYIIVLYCLFRRLLERVTAYSKGLLVAVICVFVYADSSIVTRFASFQTAPLQLILLLSMVCAAFAISDKNGAGFGVPVLIGATLLLMLLNIYCAVAGLVTAFMLLLILRKDMSTRRRFVYVLCAMLLCMMSVVRSAQMIELQSPEEKYDQMTRGVLFQAENPEEALKFFNIEPRYSVLTETYAAQQFPVVLPAEGLLDEGFFDHYSTSEIIMYYVSHPGELLSLMNIGVYRAFITQSDYSGHYEMSAGKPPRAKTLLMSVWLRFKAQSASQSTGFILVLVGLIVLLGRGKKRKNEARQQEQRLYRSLVGFIAVFCLAELMTVIVMSGDSLLMTESFLMSACIDVLVLLLLAEVLHKSKMISDDPR